MLRHPCLPLFVMLMLFVHCQGRRLRSHHRRAKNSSRALLQDIDSEQRLRHAVNLWQQEPDICTGVYGHISDWDVSKVKTMRGLFANLTEEFNEDLSRWDVSNIVDMSYAFQNAKSFNGDLSSWDVSRVKYMNNMFQGAYRFNSNMTHWNTAKVFSFAYQFAGASSFNGDISDWDVANSYDLSHMFHDAISFNGNISTWMITKQKEEKQGLVVVWEQYLDSMFQNATSFNGDLSKWDTYKVGRMPSMFEGAAAFNGDLSSWRVPLVGDMNRMFTGASSYHNHNLCWHFKDSHHTNTTDIFLGTSNNTLNGGNCPPLPKHSPVVTNVKKPSSFTETYSVWTETAALTLLLLALIAFVVGCLNRRMTKTSQDDNEEEVLTVPSGSDDDHDHDDDDDELSPPPDKVGNQGMLVSKALPSSISVAEVQSLIDQGKKDKEDERKPTGALAA